MSIWWIYIHTVQWERVTRNEHEGGIAQEYLQIIASLIHALNTTGSDDRMPP